jgi:hypothetical protein
MPGLEIQMNPFPSRQTVTFIVRIWAEYLQEQPPRWSGVIEPVEGGEKIHFTDLTQITDIIQQKTPSEKFIDDLQK